MELRPVLKNKTLRKATLAPRTQIPTHDTFKIHLMTPILSHSFSLDILMLDLFHLKHIYMCVCVCVCVCVCKGHSINKVKFYQEEALFTIERFSKKSIVLGPFMFQKIDSMTFFTDCFTLKTLSFHSMDCLFQNKLIVANPYLARLQTFSH